LNIQGLLVEYLITGAFTLIWIGGLITLSGRYSFDQLNVAEVTALVPLAYVVGTFVDYLSRELTRAIDEKHGRRGKFGTEKYYVEAEFCFAPPLIRKEAVRVAGKEEMFVRAPEAAKQYELRKARDRAARGVFANFVIMTFAIPPIVAYKNPVHLFYAVPLLIGLCWFSFKVWRKMVDLSVTFRNDVAIEFLRQDESTSTSVSLPALAPRRGGGVGAVLLVITVVFVLRCLRR